MTRVVCEYKKIFLRGGTTAKDMEVSEAKCATCTGDVLACSQCSECCLVSQEEKKWARHEWRETARVVRR